MQQKLHVIQNQQHLDPEKLPGKVVVVFDVIFATTTIAMALANGASEVITVPEIEDARKLGADGVVLAGEKNAVIPSGFQTFAPLGLSKCELKQKKLVLVSTNGTVALHRARTAAHLYSGAIVNATALCEHILAHHKNETILLVCAASKDKFNIEDFAGAGMVASILTQAAQQRFCLSDSAVASITIAKSSPLNELLMYSRVGNVVAKLNLSADTELSSKQDYFPVVPKYLNGRLLNIS